MSGRGLAHEADEPRVWSQAWDGVVAAGGRRAPDALAEDIRAHGRSALVLNLSSRRGGRHSRRVGELLGGGGLDLRAVHPVTDPAQLPAALHAAADSGADLIVVGGGDGTHSEAAHQFAHRDVCLGVLPLGTTNNFARGLRIPRNLAGAVRTLTEGRVAEVDLGHVAGRHFANLASLGLSVPVAERVPAGLKRVLGRGAYPLTALALLPGHRPFTVRVWAHGRWHQLRTHQFNIANGSHQAGRAIAADAALDDGQLVAYGLGDSTRRRLVAATVRQALAGPYRPVARASFLAAPELWLDTDPPARLDIDGEIHGGTPLHITVEPKALRVMVPAPTPRGSAGR